MAGISQIPKEMIENFPYDILSWTRSPISIFLGHWFENKTKHLLSCLHILLAWPKTLQKNAVWWEPSLQGPTAHLLSCLGSEGGHSPVQSGQHHIRELCCCRRERPAWESRCPVPESVVPSRCSVTGQLILVSLPSYLLQSCSSSRAPYPPSGANPTWVRCQMPGVTLSLPWDPASRLSPSNIITWLCAGPPCSLSPASLLSQCNLSGGGQKPILSLHCSPQVFLQVHISPCCGLASNWEWFLIALGWR